MPSQSTPLTRLLDERQDYLTVDEIEFLEDLVMEYSRRDNKGNGTTRAFVAQSALQKIRRLRHTR